MREDELECGGGGAGMGGAIMCGVGIEVGIEVEPDIRMWPTGHLA